MKRARKPSQSAARGGRTARENLADLTGRRSGLRVWPAVAAQRTRREGDALYAETAADAVITAVGPVNGDIFSAEQSQAALIINDYTVLAGTQGYFHHRKIDRMLGVAERDSLPIVMYTEGGGVVDRVILTLVSMAGLNVPTFHRWAALPAGPLGLRLITVTALPATRRSLVLWIPYCHRGELHRYGGPGDDRRGWPRDVEAAGY